MSDIHLSPIYALLAQKLPEQFEMVSIRSDRIGGSTNMPTERQKNGNGSNDLERLALFANVS